MNDHEKAEAATMLAADILTMCWARVPPELACGALTQVLSNLVISMSQDDPERARRLSAFAAKNLTEHTEWVLAQSKS